MITPCQMLVPAVHWSKPVKIMAAQYTSDEVLEAIANSSVAFRSPGRSFAPVVMDPRYCLLTDKYLLGAFANGFDKYLKTFGLKRYVDVRNNCNKFSRHAVAYALLCHQVKGPIGLRTGVGFGVFGYITDAGTGHMLNIHIKKHRSGVLTAQFFEPQTLEFVQLSDQEKASCDVIVI